MKQNYFKACLLSGVFSLLSIAGFSQASRSTINIDFGGSGQVSPAPWNNITNARTGSVANLTNDQGVETGISIAITTPFNALNNVTATAEDSLGIHPMAATDNFYGDNGYPVAVLTISNLDVNKPYSFAFFGNRGGITENRETQFTVEGLTTAEPVGINVSSNTSRMARVSNVLPNAEGKIMVAIEKGPANVNSTGYFHLSAVRISYSNSTASVSPDIAAGKINVYPNPATGLVSINTGGESKVQSVTLVSISGVQVLERSSTSGSVESLDVSGLAKGLYYMQIDTNKGRFHTKLVVNK